MSTPLALSPNEAAAALGVSRRGLYQLIAAGKIKARKLGPRTLVDYATVAAYYASLPEMASGASTPNAPQSKGVRP